MPATTGGRPTSGTRKRIYRRPTAPASQGHPSRGGTTVGGATKKGGRPKPYVTPTGNTRPAPKMQPGPIRATERRKVVRHKRTKAYKRAREAARRAGLRERQRQYLKRKQPGPFTDTEREAVEKYERRVEHELAGMDKPRYLGGRTPRTEAGRENVTKQERGFLAGYSLKDLKAHQQQAISKTVAPGLKALEVSTRPAKVVGNVIKGERVDRAVKKGAKGEGPLPGEALGLKGVAGFAADVALDPTTYASLGTSVPAKKAVQKAGEEAAKKGAKAGMSKAGQATVRKQAEKRAAKVAPDNKGVTFGMGVGHRRVTTSGRTTAAINRKLGGSKAAKRIRRTKPVQSVGRHMRPDFRPEGVGREAHQAVRAAGRKRRAASHQGQKQAQGRAVAYSKALSPKDYERVIDAIESGKLGKLPENLRKVAKRMRDDFRYMQRQERQRGIAGKPMRDYFPHTRRQDIEPGAPKVRETGRAAKLGSSKHRTIRQPLKELREESPDLFSENVPLVYGNRAVKSAKGVADADFIRAVASTGRKLTAKAEWDTATEAVYKVTSTGLKKLEAGGKTDVKAIARALDATQPDAGQYVILNKALADDAMRGIRPGDTGLAGIGRAWDRKIQGPIKTLLTVPNPQYHFTNLYGDLFNAYLGDVSAHSIGQAARAVRHMAHANRAARKLDPGAASEAGLKIGGEKITYEQLIKEAEQHGAIGTGFIGRDLPDVLEAFGKETAGRVGAGRVARRLGGPASKVAAKAHPIQAIRDISQYREDFVRLASYISARKAGRSPDEAAEWVARHHFDYGDLTEFERTVLRRVFPFYTFTARNAPLQAGKLITRPGKYATLEKARHEAAVSAGMEPGYEANLEEYEQRGLPVPIPGFSDDQGFPLLLYPKLPAMDLNRLTANPYKQRDLVVSMISPIIKSPFEFLFNYNTFFRGPIDAMQTRELEKLSPELRRRFGIKDSDLRTLLPAPSLVAMLPSQVREALGITKYRERKTGKQIWGWPAKLDYALRQTPASSTAIQFGSDSKNRLGRDRTLQLMGWMTGLKFSPYNKADQRVERHLTAYFALQAKAQSMRRRGTDRKPNGDYTKEYRRTLDFINELGPQISEESKKRGDKIPLFAPREKKESNPFEGRGKSDEENPFKGSSGDTEDNPFRSAVPTTANVRFDAGGSMGARFRAEDEAWSRRKDRRRRADEWWLREMRGRDIIGDEYKNFESDDRIYGSPSQYPSRRRRLVRA